MVTRAIPSAARHGQYKVIINYKAEFGEAASAVVVTDKIEHQQLARCLVLLRTRIFARPNEMTQPLPPAIPEPSPSDEYGFAVGDPIIQDALHFLCLGAQKSLTAERGLPGGGASLATAQAVLPTSVFAQFGPVTNPFQGGPGFRQGDTTHLTDRFELSGKLRRETQVSGASGKQPRRLPRNTRTTTFVRIAWRRSADRWVNDASDLARATESTTDSSNPTPVQCIYFPNSRRQLLNAGLITVGGPGSGLFRNAQSGAELRTILPVELQWLGDHWRSWVAGIRASTSPPKMRLTIFAATYYYSVTPAGVAATPTKVQFPRRSLGWFTKKVTSKDKQFGVARMTGN